MANSLTYGTVTYARENVPSVPWLMSHDQDLKRTVRVSDLQCTHNFVYTVNH